MNVKNVILQLLIISLMSCSPVEKASNYQAISNTHKIIAVLPPIVNIEIKNVKEAKLIKDQEKLESMRFQKSLVDYLNDHSKKGDFFVTIQLESETNRILAENNITSLTNQSYQQLAKILNVDAVVTSRISLAKPMTNAEAFFTNLLVGPGAASNISTVDLSLSDAQSGKTFWNYNWQTGGTFTSTNSLTNSLMKSAAYRFPYKKSDLIKK
jgi:hypothetical protein